MATRNPEDCPQKPKFSTMDQKNIRSSYPEYSNFSVSETIDNSVLRALSDEAIFRSVCYRSNRLNRPALEYLLLKFFALHICTFNEFWFSTFTTDESDKLSRFGQQVFASKITPRFRKENKPCRSHLGTYFLPLFTRQRTLSHLNCATLHVGVQPRMINHLDMGKRTISHICVSDIYSSSNN